MLSYAGSRDPLTNQIWGGVVANAYQVIGNWGDGNSGFYTNFSYQSITGDNVASNWRVDGTAGTYWKVYTRSQGSLTVGINFSAMHYDKNLRYFTYGQGGYFSPQEYFLFNIPIRWSGTWRRQIQYAISGSLGYQHFVEDDSPYFPVFNSVTRAVRLILLRSDKYWSELQPRRQSRVSAIAQLAGRSLRQC